MSRDMNDKDLEKVSGVQTFEPVHSGGGPGGGAPGEMVTPSTPPPVGGAPEPTKEAPESDPENLEG